MDIRESLPHMRNTPSHRVVQRATGVDRRTVKQYRKWAQEHGPLTGPSPSAEELPALVRKTLGGPPRRWAAESYSGAFLMNSIKVFVEIGEKRVFIGAVDWPGWCRSGRDEKTALQALIDYGPRYAQVLHSRDIKFQVPTDASDLIVTERHDGNATTDFGAPAIMLDADREPIDRIEFQRLQTLLVACWQAFDSAVQRASGRELRKGPRGGGRDIEEILDHVLEADQRYLARLAWEHKREGGENPVEELSRTRQAILNALEVAVVGDLPEQGPRGGIIWPPRYSIRRVAWHVLDHAWEIDDRVV